MKQRATGETKRVHPHAWLWEPLEDAPSFVNKPMFGTRAVYLEGRLLFAFSARHEPWRGVLVATEREHHTSLQKEFSSLRPHPILPKWLYLSEAASDFERCAEKLVSLARRGDPRIGIVPPAAKQGRGGKSRASVRRRRGDHP